MCLRKKMLGKNIEELTAIAGELGLPPFTGRQLSEWLYKKDVTLFGEMTNLSLKARSILESQWDTGLQEPVHADESADGTKKYLFPAGEGHFVETAYIPEKNRNTICISSQVGCKWGCLFCMTGKQGFQGNLTAGEILNQLRSLPEKNQVTNVVYMGMGEPMDNLDEVLRSLEILTAEWGFAMSPRRITVSTIGVIPAMREFLTKSQAHLAVSLHSPFEEERRKLMPVEQVHPIAEVLKEIRSWDFGRQRRVSFEYILFKGLNDSAGHVNELSRILHGIRCRINLIRFHPFPGTSLESPDEPTIQFFGDRLNSKGITTTIRASRGEDIRAACGLLSTKEQSRLR
ncbi:MAG TPA: 23S rRNA (adenine(2503)-C(2))-methyltransferase RlmN [Bacteroides sp.]|nr:23S rRNA (adenine(2503)-C(2))-methyltransferase RlmN [Bacteroides sp.]